MSELDGLSTMAEKTPVTRPAQSSRAPLGTCCRVEQRRARIESHDGSRRGGWIEGGGVDT